MEPPTRVCAESTLGPPSDSHRRNAEGRLRASSWSVSPSLLSASCLPSLCQGALSAAGSSDSLGASQRDCRAMPSPCKFASASPPVCGSLSTGAVPRGCCRRPRGSGTFLCLALLLVALGCEQLPSPRQPLFSARAAEPSTLSSSDKERELNRVLQDLERLLRPTPPSASSPASPDHHGREATPPPSVADLHLLEALSAYRLAQQSGGSLARDPQALASLLRELQGVQEALKRSLPPLGSSAVQGSGAGETYRPRESAESSLAGSSSHDFASFRRSEDERARREERKPATSHLTVVVTTVVCTVISLLVLFVILRVQTNSMVRSGKAETVREGNKRLLAPGRGRARAGDCCEGDAAAPERVRHVSGASAYRQTEDAAREPSFSSSCGSSRDHALRRRPLKDGARHSARRDEQDEGRGLSSRRAVQCAYSSAARQWREGKSHGRLEEIDEDEEAACVHGMEARRDSVDCGRNRNVCPQEKSLMDVSSPSGSEFSGDEAEGARVINHTARQVFGQRGDSSESLASSASTRQVPQPSPHVAEKQQRYEDLCSSLFQRLGELLQEEDLAAQNKAEGDGAEEAVKATGSDAKGASEVANGSKKEIEEILTKLALMLKDIERDFSGSRPGYITCMIRCCNSLLRLDGLTLLSRCSKEEGLRNKAQEVIETVVPCIWSS
ncbi:hypothetical protein BESB_046500 [Besnoitia besnoiti]|uniref:Transmembrane protein n=1 Tax=Besnoitia besnoiti TaxID=94643 RepID=A0A2A9MD84_BESBE|nr:hypothetical protein BESB_046500 [Besnoitia besnoiti]PFH36458.1 hypothetical protein BESB_046500 [Besnoitia besnoiti]